MKTKIFTFFLLFLSVFSFSQKKEVNLQIEYLIENKIPSLDIIDSILFEKRKDKPLLELLVKKSKENSYFQGELYGYNSLGRHFRDLSLFDKSIDKYKKALVISRKTKDTISEVKILNAIGSVYRRQDDVRNALNYHQEALEKAINIKNPKIDIKESISNAQNSIGNIYLSLKQYKISP